MNVTLRQIKVLLELGRVKSFTKTGGMIGLTQSAVSRSVRELESELGVVLFDRNTREVELTDIGRRLAAVLEPLVDELDRVLATAHNAAEQLQGKVRVATSPTISANLMPFCISECNRQFPDIQLILHDKVQRLVMDSVRHGEVDFGVIVEPKSPDEFSYEPIMREPFYVICRPEHPFARSKTVRWTKLDGQQIVLLDHASGSRQVIDEALESQGIRCVVAQELGHSTTVFQMVSAGIGIGILPLLSMPVPESSKLVARLLIPKVNRTIMLARRKNRSLSPVAETVWNLIADVAKRRDGLGGIELHQEG